MSKHRYEGLIVLNTKGTEENAKELIERIEGEFKKEGAKIEQVQRLEKRHFSYVAGPLSSGYYVNFIFEADASLIAKLDAKFKLDSDVYRRHFQKLAPKKTAAAKTEK